MQDTIQKQKAHFESVSEAYFEATQHPACLTFNHLIWAHFFKDHPEVLPAGAQVLEPMCGQGSAKEWLEQSLHNHFTYTGFDYSEPLVEIARRRLPESSVFVQDVTTFQATQAYDLIFLAGGLHHVYTQTREVLENLRKALRPGGYMVSAEPTYDNPFYGLLGRTIYKHSDKFDNDSEARYSLRDLNRHYQAAGFTIADQMHFGLLGYIISVSAFCFPRFSIASPALMRTLVALESPFYRSWICRKLSFCTITLLQNQPLSTSDTI